MSAHTPGPWWFTTDHPDNACAYVKAARPGYGFETEVAALWAIGENEIEQRDASARLIAAAPTMLEALEDLLQRFAPSDDGLGEAEIACAQRARAAIAKATGGGR